MKLCKDDIQNLGKSNLNISDSDLHVNPGLNRNQILKINNKSELPTEINIYNYIENNPIDISDGYVLDVETYRLNSRIRMIQLYDIKEKLVHLFIDGIPRDVKKIEDHLAKYNIKLKIYSYNNKYSIVEKTKSGIPRYISFNDIVYYRGRTATGAVYHVKDDLNQVLPYPRTLVTNGILKDDLNERMMLYDFITLLKEHPKQILGHNVAHFDLGIIGSLIQEFNIKGLKIFEYIVSPGDSQQMLAFSYTVSMNTKLNEKWYQDTNRYNIIDTMFIAKTTGLKDISLKKLSENSKFPKRDIDFRVFESRMLDYDSILYSIYDVLAIPGVYKYLWSLWSPAIKNISAEYRHSQRTPEHVLMKGSGCLAESFLNKLLNGNININSYDHLSKYFGGITRVWDHNLIVSDDVNKIRYLDFTSFYPFSCLKQKIFDILNGDCERFSDTPFHEVKQYYDDFIYSSIFEIKAKDTMLYYIEGEVDKKTQTQFGIGYYRSFEKDKRIADLQHQFGAVKVYRGDKIILTKAELEINKALYPNYKFIITKVIDGLIPKSHAKSEEYINTLFVERKKLIAQDNEAERGYKQTLNSLYGKLAESKGKYFHLACASAITAFCRATLIKTIVYACRNNIHLIYSDTDSCYVLGNETSFKKLQKYANELNPLPNKYGEECLKDEGEDVRCFHAIKRKRYVKVIKKDGRNIIKLAGQNGNADIRWRDVLWRTSAIVGGELNISKINSRIQNEDFKLQWPTADKFEKVCKDLYKNSKNVFMFKFIPVVSNAKITRMFNVRFKKSTKYENGVYYHRIRTAWEKETGRKAYIGCFFSIARDNTFIEPGPEQIDRWGLNYDNYKSTTEKIPVIHGKFYYDMLTREINIDTIKIKTRKGINANEFRSDEERRALSGKIMTSGFVASSNKVGGMYGDTAIFRVRIPYNLDHEKVEFLKGQRDGQYANATLFITKLLYIDAGIRIQKVKMFLPKRDIFSIFRFTNNLGIMVQKLLLKKFQNVTISTRKKIKFGPVKLNSFPRLTYVYQVDIYQPTSEDHARRMHISAFDTSFHNSKQGHSWLFNLTDYITLSIYNKKESAQEKLELFDEGMEKFERDVFEFERDEGNKTNEHYRSEIKSELRRNIHESLSYIYAFSIIDQYSFHDMIIMNNTKFKYSRKKFEFSLNIKVMTHGKLKGNFIFNKNKCIILFSCTEWLIKNFYNYIQEYQENLSQKEPSPLAGSWETYVVPPRGFRRKRKVGCKMALRRRPNGERM